MSNDAIKVISQLKTRNFTTADRDILLRFLVFSSRLTAWRLGKRNASASAVERWRALIKQLSLTTKLLRVGKFIQHFEFAARILTGKHQDRFLGHVTIARQLLMAVHMTCDNATLLNSIGFVPWKGAKGLETRAFRVWFSATLCGVVIQLYCFYRLHLSSKGREEGDEPTVFQQTASKLQLFSGLCDLSVSSAAAGVVRLDEGVVSLCGLTSSIIAIYTQFRSSHGFGVARASMVGNSVANQRYKAESGILDMLGNR
ncbi:hypothetical protein F66182_4469 [Fusarium sp. NRRL 66182]|nr:hypothetical protein F66182_4469 [Fusarium sp. NRRL 66182]